MKKPIKFLQRYFVVSLFIMTMLMLIHYPNNFFHGTTLEYLYKYIFDEFSISILLKLIGYIILSAILFIPFLIFSKIKYIGWIPLAIFSFFVGLEKYVFYLNGYHTPWNIAFNDTMLINFMVNPTGFKDSLETFGSDIYFWIYLVIFPLFLFIILKLISNTLPTITKSNISKLLFAIAFSLIIFAPAFFSFKSYVPYVYRVQYTIIMHIENYLLTLAGIKREEILFKSIIKTDTPKNIVYIVDESIRGDLISINNDKEDAVMKATPYLYSIKDKLINFGNLYSLTNCSFPSNQNFLIGFDKKYSEKVSNYVKVAPTIYQYMKNAGYKTYYIDNVHNGLYTIFTAEDSNYLDVVYNDYIKWKKYPKFKRDFKTLDQIRDILNNGDKNFIFILKYGLHFPFKNSFNNDEPLFENFKGGTIQQQFNLYMNGIYNSVDKYWKHLVEVVGNTDTVVLWQSDHSVNITKNKNTTKDTFLTHCEFGLTYYEEMHSIPGVLYSPHKKYYDGYKNLKNGYSVKPMFSTILDFAGYDSKDYERIYGPSFKNPTKDVSLFNFKTNYTLNLDNIYDVVDKKAKENISDLNRKRVLDNTLPNRKFINKPIDK